MYRVYFLLVLPQISLSWASLARTIITSPSSLDPHPLYWTAVTLSPIRG